MMIDDGKLYFLSTLNHYFQFEKQEQVHGIVSGNFEELCLKATPVPVATCQFFNPEQNLQTKFDPKNRL